mmetsp:Transcript_7854/g.16961  ORF Transcript_7854/g.16961 Transcript_7854/m.16961 type:complete len:110 (-) Transcript_7854:1893-2222(-)
MIPSVQYQHCVMSALDSPLSTVQSSERQHRMDVLLCGCALFGGLIPMAQEKREQEREKACAPVLDGYTMNNHASVECDNITLTIVMELRVSPLQVQRSVSQQRDRPNII